jgi:hypothetical protein
MTQAFKIRLTGPNGELAFEASAPLTESRQASYTGMDIVHLPTNIHAFKNTGSRKFTITGKLVSRTASEANANVRNLDLARAWLLPDFGRTGATPPILRLYAYGNKNINGRKVIMTSYDWTFGDEVDYIHTGSQPMPVIGQLTINVEEVYSAAEVTNGNWRLDLAEGGRFEPGEQASGGGLDITIPGALMQLLGKPDLTPSGILGSVSNQLQKSVTPTLAGVIAGQLTRSLGAKIINSPQVQSVIKGVPGFARNIFVAGANATVTDLGRVATNRVSEVTTPKPPADPFSAAPPKAPPTVIGE